MDDKIAIYKDIIKTLHQQMQPSTCVFYTIQNAPPEKFDRILLEVLNSTQDIIYEHRNLVKRHTKLQENRKQIMKDNERLSDNVERLLTTAKATKKTLSEVKLREIALQREIEHLREQLQDKKIVQNDKSSKINESKRKKIKNQYRKSDQVHYCSICDKLFTCRKNYVRHDNAIHKGIKFPCDLCGKSFREKYKLRVHECIIKVRVQK